MVRPQGWILGNRGPNPLSKSGYLNSSVLVFSSRFRILAYNTQKKRPTQMQHLYIRCKGLWTVNEKQKMWQHGRAAPTTAGGNTTPMSYKQLGSHWHDGWRAALPSLLPPGPPHGVSRCPQNLLQRQRWAAGTTWSWARWGHSPRSWCSPGTWPGAQAGSVYSSVPVTAWELQIPAHKAPSGLLCAQGLTLHMLSSFSPCIFPG